MDVANSLLLLTEAVLYFGVMACLFRLRARVGLGLFVCALGVMHFLETYLASVFYIELPFGMVSPGSTVMFSGKLVMILLLYIKEDAATVRQPIYGLLVGNFLMVGLGLILRQHQVVDLPNGQSPDIGFLDEMGWLMVWGTTLLYIDAIAIILLYERLGRSLGQHLFARIAASVCLVLTFDQIGFYSVLHIVTGAPPSVLLGGWIAKMCAGLVFSAMTVGYLRWFERPSLRPQRGLTDVFETLTYRERYEKLVEFAGRDSLTGLLHRGRFETMGEQAVTVSVKTGTPLTLLIVDVDHFKSINDRFGHAEGDRVLKWIAENLTVAVRAQDHVFRIGGEEFAILCPLPHNVARLLGENIRQSIRAASETGPVSLTVSIGVATVDVARASLAELFAAADKRLYMAKDAGRDRVMGDVAEEAAPSGARAPSAGSAAG